MYIPKLGICEDDFQQLNELHSMVAGICSEAGVDAQIDLYSTGADLVAALKGGIVYNILLLDIEMPEPNGIKVGRVLRTELDNNKTLLIYVSLYIKYHDAILDNNAHTFIRKPVNSNEMKRKLLHAFRILDEQIRIYRFMHERSTASVRMENISYLEADTPRIHICHKTIGNYITDTYYGVFNDELMHFEGVRGFYKAHRSYLINFQHLEYIHDSFMLMKDGKKIYMSAKKIKEATIALAKFETSLKW